MQALEQMMNWPVWKLALFFIVTAVPILPNLYAIWHAFHRVFPSDKEKMTWLGICVFIPVLGGLAYIFVGRKRALGKTQAK